MPNATETPYEHSQSDKKRKESQRFVKLKEVQANTQSQLFCTTFNFTPTHPIPPITPKKSQINLDNKIIILTFAKIRQVKL